MYNVLLAVVIAWVVSAVTACGGVHAVNEHVDDSCARIPMTFTNVPAPAADDAATHATFILLDGVKDGHSGALEKLHDGGVPGSGDQPAENFFFNAGTDGGRILVDLGKAIDVKEVNTYSWHAGTRGPQVYQLYAGCGTEEGFKDRPKKGVDPLTCGWKLISKVDTRPAQGLPGGQYAVGLRSTDGAIGNFRYLLFDISRTEELDNFGNTFFSEIDVVDSRGPQEVETVEMEGGKYRVTVDTFDTPDLKEWVHSELVPVLKEWYPKIVNMLPSDGFEAPRQFSIVFDKKMDGVAATGGTHVKCAGKWCRDNLKGETRGAIVHELVHVVQQYGHAKPAASMPASNPGWLVEGVADYIRWFLFDAQAHGAEIDKAHVAGARYNASYRVTANFINWVTTTYDKDLVLKLNAAMRNGVYSEDLWKQYTGHTPRELEAEWKKALEK